MKKVILTLICAIFLISLASAEIIINQQPSELYNLGERVTIPITITTSEGIYDFLKISLICDGQEKKLPDEEIELPANEVIKIEKSIFLIEKFINKLTGTCKIKASFESKPEIFIFTNEFKISNSITLEIDSETREFNPEESILIQGKATKENGDLVNGFLELEVISDTNSTDNKLYQEIINNGFFSVNLSMSKETKAGDHLFKLNAYEKDPLNEISNKGDFDLGITITQIPTSLEIVFEDNSVNPGENLKVKVILHDQTGEKILSSAIITIKNQENEIMEQTEMITDVYLDFPILYNEAPSEWMVVAVSNKMTSESTFTIKEKMDVNVEIINKTVILTNVGNVPYNNSILIKIGNESLNIDDVLLLDESKKYALSAPNGEYEIEIITVGETKVKESVLLTGNVIGVKELSGIEVLAKYPLAWIFIILILGFVAFMIYRKGYKKSFSGYVNLFKKVDQKKTLSNDEISEKVTIANPQNKVELSLSLKGDKQTASLVCLKIKNLNEISKQEDSTKETIKKITDFAEENQALVYENQNNLFFILAPITTKSFKTGDKAIEIAQKTKALLMEHNKLMKQKIDFGISLNQGHIIAQKEGDVYKIMSFGTLITGSKKLASLSNKNIYLSESLKNSVMSNVKTKKHDIDGVSVYTIKEIRKTTEESKKFIKNFVDKLDKDKKE